MQGSQMAAKAGIMPGMRAKRGQQGAAPAMEDRISADFELRRSVLGFSVRNEQVPRTTASARLTCRVHQLSDFPFDTSDDAPKPLLPLHSQSILQAEVPDHVVRDTGHFLRRGILQAANHERD